MWPVFAVTSQPPSAGRTVGPATDCRAWDSFVARQPAGDLLQSWAWSEAGKASGETWERVAAFEPDGSIGALAQYEVRRTLFGRSVLYAAHGPVWPRSAPDSGAALDSLLRGLKRIGRQQGAMSVTVDPRRAARVDLGPRHPEAVIDPTADMIDRGLHKMTLNIQLPTTRVVSLLDGGEALMATWDADVRRLVRRGRNEGVEVEVLGGDDAKGIRQLYDLLHTTGERSGFQPRPLCFIETLGREFQRGQGALLVLAHFQRRVIAGALTLRLRERAWYQVAGSIKERAIKHANGPYAVMARTMSELASSGVRTLDLAGVVERNDYRSDPAWEGLSAFKRGFGGEPVRHPGTFDLVVDPFWYTLRGWRRALVGLGRVRATR